MTQLIALLKIAKSAGARRSFKSPYRIIQRVESGRRKQDERQNMKPVGDVGPDIKECQTNEQANDAKEQPAMAP